MVKPDKLHRLRRSSKEAYIFGIASLLSQVVKVNLVFKSVLILVLVYVAYDFSVREIPVKTTQKKRIVAGLIGFVVLSFLVYGIWQQRTEDEHTAVLDKLPLCNKANSMVFWLVSEQRVYHAKFLSTAKNGSTSPDELVHAIVTHDKEREAELSKLFSGEMKTLNDEYGQRFYSHTEEMENLSDEMLAKMGKTGPRLNVIELSRSQNWFLGSLGLDRTAKYFTDLSKQLGCPTPPIPWNQ